MSISYTIRPARPGDGMAVAHIQVDTWKSSYADIVDAGFLANLSYERSQEQWEKAIARKFPFLVAEAEGRVVGFVSTGKSRVETKDGAVEVFALYIWPEYQRKGIGSALLHRVTKELYTLGFTEIDLQVLEGNSAARFYESCGWTKANNGKFQIGDRQYNVIVYRHRQE